MSIVNVRGYFRTHMNAAGFVEWKEGFNRDDIGNTVINKAYHIMSPTIVQESHNQIHLQLVETIEVTFYLKGYRTPADAIDQAHTEIRACLRRILDHANRTQGNVKNVVLDNIDIEPYDETNDNMVRVLMRFRVLVIEDVTDV